MIKIILFGAGGGGNKIFQIINKINAKVIAYIDNDPSKAGQKLNGISIISIEQLVDYDYEYDWILIASTFYHEITSQLIDHGVDENKIIPTIKYLQILFKYHLEKYLSRKDEIEAIITGISYTAHGFNLGYLKPITYNFAMGMQDLYYDYHIAKYILEYIEGFKKIRYCIIGLAYYSFEYDLSLSKHKECVFRYSDIFNIHHNNEVFEQEYTRIKKIFRKILKNNYFNLFYELEKFTLDNHFQNISDGDYVKFIQVNGQFEKGLENATKNANIDFKKDYPATVKENKAIFYSFLKLLTKYDIKTIIVVLPSFRAYNKQLPKKIDTTFNEIIQEAKTNFHFQLLDYFRSPLFTDADFFDGSHLSNKGAIKFTKIFNEDVNW